MAVGNAATIRGLAEAQRTLKELPRRAARAALMVALRAGAKPIQQEASNLAPWGFGTLASEIVIRAARGVGDEVVVKVGTSKAAPHGHLVEFGTKPHLIKPVRAKKLKFGPVIISGSVQHPGTVAQPFLRPAVEAKEREAQAIVADRLGDALERAAVRIAAKNGVPK